VFTQEEPSGVAGFSGQRSWVGHREAEGLRGKFVRQLHSLVQIPHEDDAAPVGKGEDLTFLTNSPR